MIGEKCRTCDSRYPACQDHCEYGIAAKQERKRLQAERERHQSREAWSYYKDKKYRR